MLLVLNTPDVMEINNAGVSKICRVKIYPALVEFNCENWWRRYRDLLCSEAQAVRYITVQYSTVQYITLHCIALHCSAVQCRAVPGCFVSGQIW